MLVIMTNGAPYAGKSYFNTELSRLLGRELGFEHRIMPHISILREMLYQFAERFDNVTHNRNDVELYNELKTRVYYGKTGREWQICWGTGMRSLNQNIFSLDLFKRIDYFSAEHSNGVVLVDDLGFHDEVIFALRQAGHQIKIVYLGARLPRIYRDSEQFDNDSRFCLRQYANWIDPTPVELRDWIVANR